MNPNALWPDDDNQDSLFPDVFNEPARAATDTSKPTPGSAAAVQLAPAKTVKDLAPAAIPFSAMPLADLFRLKADVEIRLGHQSADLDAAVFAVTPDGGWEGKNAEQRDHAKRVAMNGYDHIRVIEDSIGTLNDTLTRVKAEVAARQAEMDEVDRQQKRVDSDIRARDITLRSAELDHARAVFNATHKNTDH